MSVSSSKGKQNNGVKQQHTKNTGSKQGSRETTTAIKTSSSGPASIVTDEQNIYSNILSAGRKLGLTTVSIALGIYAAGLVAPKIPVASLPKYWGLSSSQFMRVAGIKPGWSWIGMYRYSDMLNYFGIAILGAVSAICYIAIVPSMIRKKDYSYAIIAIVEVLVLVLAASGIFNISE